MMEIKLRLSMLVVIETNAKSRKKVDSGGNPIFFFIDYYYLDLSKSANRMTLVCCNIHMLYKENVTWILGLYLDIKNYILIHMKCLKASYAF